MLPGVQCVTKSISDIFIKAYIFPNEKLLIYKKIIPQFLDNAIFHLREIFIFQENILFQRSQIISKDGL